MWTTMKLEFKPGVIADSSELSSEGGYVTANNVRWRRGYAQTIGGWERYSDTTFTGVVRGADAWATLDGSPRLAYGTQDHLYAGTTPRDITPKLTEVLLGANPFSQVSGSKIVTVTHPGHGLRVGNSVTFVTEGTNVRTETVTGVIDVNHYTYELSVAASSTKVFGGAGIAQAKEDFSRAYASLPTGVLDASASPFTLPTTWSIDNFGEQIVALRDGDTLCAGYILDADPEELIVNGGFATDSDWAKGSFWTIAAGVAKRSAGAASNLSQNLSGKVKPGHTYRLTFNSKRLATGDSPTMAVSLYCGDPLAMVDIFPGYYPQNTTNPGYSVVFVAPAGPISDIVFRGNGSTGSGQTIDNVSLKEVEAAPLSSAPTYANSMFVDPNRFVVLLGTTEADGDFNPMLVRWCAQENLREWVPDSDNLAGEYPLTVGGRIIAGLPTRQQNLIWTDAALYSMQFTGSSDTVFSFDMLASGCGLMARFAMAEINGTAFWMAADGNFYIFQGAIPQIIDCPVRDDVFGNINEAQQSKVYAGINSKFSEICWFYPRGENTDCSHYVAYNWVENYWTQGEMARTTWIQSGIFPNPIAFCPNCYVYKQEYGTKANGSILPWSLETGYTDIEDGDKLLAISEYRCDHAYQTGSMKISFDFKNDAIGSIMKEGPHIVTPTTKRVRFRRMARQMKIRWENGTDSEGFRDGVKNVVVQKTGARR